MRPKMVLVYRAPTGLEAHVVRSALEQHDIPVEVRNEMLSSLGGGLPMLDTMVEVWIPEAHVEDAQPVLQTIQRPIEGAGQLSLADPDRPEGALSEAPNPGTLSPAKERPCPACGESVPPELHECWNCQQSLVD